VTGQQSMEGGTGGRLYGATSVPGSSGKADEYGLHVELMRKGVLLAFALFIVLGEYQL
jgi:hypothetical protein